MIATGSAIVLAGAIGVGVALVAAPVAAVGLMVAGTVAVTGGAALAGFGLTSESGGGSSHDAPKVHNAY